MSVIQLPLFYDKSHMLWMTKLTVGPNPVQVAVDTGSPYLVVNSSQCRSCPLEYGTYNQWVPHSGSDRLVYATQRVKVDFRKDIVHELGQLLTFGAAVADQTTQMAPVNVLGLQYSDDPRSVCAQLGMPAITLNFKKRMLFINAIDRNVTFLKWTNPIRCTVRGPGGTAHSVRLMIDSGTSFTRGNTVPPGVPYTLNFDNGLYLNTFNQPKQSTLPGFDVVLGHRALDGRVVCWHPRLRLWGFT